MVTTDPYCRQYAASHDYEFHRQHATSPVNIYEFLWHLECQHELPRRRENPSEDSTAESSSNKKRKAPEGATGTDDGEETKKELANKYLVLCVANYGGGSSVPYLIVLTKADYLFDKQPRIIRVQFPGDSKAGNWFGMGCAISGTDLYLAGGQKIENTSSDSSSDSDSCDYSSEVFRVRLDCLAKFLQTDIASPILSEKVSPMRSEIASPLIIPGGKKLYMLAGPPLSMLPDYPFQVYDPEKEPTKPWKELESPPFLNLDSKYFQDSQIRSYVVFENEIHVSTSSFSFTFDTTDERTDKKKWDACRLFDDPKENVRRYIEIQNPPEYGWMIYPPNSKEECCGRPFEFDGRAVNFELRPHRIIICLALFPSTEVVAYKFVDGKAPDKQVLLQQKQLHIPPDATAYLADFKDGFLCLLTISDDHQLKQDCQISITPFEVSKLEPEMPPGNFLKCTPWEKIDYKLEDPSPVPAEQPSSKIWTPIGSFVVD
ncbi:unnamed protein product [Camellia sinensis]